MTALPLAEPPADDVADLLDLIAQARINLRHCEQALARIQADPNLDTALSPAARMYYDVDRVVAKYRVELWALVLRELSTTAHEMGLQP